MVVAAGGSACLLNCLLNYIPNCILSCILNYILSCILSCILNCILSCILNCILNCIPNCILSCLAGGLYDGRGLAAALALGAAGVWVGTRFVAAEEAAAPTRHKEGVVNACATDTVRTLIYSGRPVRTLMTEYVREWEEDRPDEIRELCKQGLVPLEHEMKVLAEKDEQISIARAWPLLMGQAAGGISSVQPAKQIVTEMVASAVSILQKNASLINSKL